MKLFKIHLFFMDKQTNGITKNYFKFGNILYYLIKLLAIIIFVYFFISDIFY